MGVDGPVIVLAVYDAGTGPLLYAGGYYHSVDGLAAEGLARWDGISWSPLPGENFRGIVSGMQVYDDGTGPALFVRASIDEAGTVPDGISLVRWDGSHWSALFAGDGTAIASSGALTVFDAGDGPELYMAYGARYCGGAPGERIARWDGLSCSVVPGVFEQGAVLSTLAVADAGDGPKLYVGGEFATIDGVEMNNIASWDGSAWSSLEGPNGTGTNNGVTDIVGYDDGHGPAVFVTGAFDQAGGRQSGAIASWSCSLVFADGFESGNLSSWSVP